MSGELGEDVTVGTARGAREFAAGDRIMFLKNGRELGVRNGTLGTIELVSSERLAVRPENGRSIAFATKDYAHIDHGYAATFHKAQGVTVDRAHVLATPGIDRHSAYVGLSRHRDRVELHYGRDDFADRDQLVRTLSRERTKDMAADYAPDVERDGARAFADRREIRFPDRPEHASPEEERRLARRRAFERHARAVSAIFGAQERGLTASPEQVSALQQTRRELDAIRPQASFDIETAFKADPSLVHEAAGGKLPRAVQAMQLETELRSNPAARADRVIERWKQLDRQMTAAYRAGDIGAERRIRNSMGVMAKSLERDPQLESILATRKSQLGVNFEIGRELRRELAASIGFDWGRGRGLGR